MTNQPVCTIKKLKGEEIKSGEHSSRFAIRWNRMSPQEKKKFDDIAIARQAQMQSKKLEEAQEYESQYEHG